MNWHFKFKTCLSLSLLVLLSACGKQLALKREQHPIPQDALVEKCKPGRYGGVFTLAASQEPKTFNYIGATDAYSGEAIGLMLKGLIDYDYFTEEYKPALAKSWDISDDKLSYTFHLREDIKWSDGHPFTADDVIFTFDTIFDPQTGNRYVSYFTVFDEPIKYEKLDAHTVRFSTRKPFASFLYTMLLANILPKHKLEDSLKNDTFLQQWSLQTAMDTPEEIVVTGPFRLQSFRTGERMVFEPNPHYYKVDEKRQRLPYIDHLIYKFVTDANTQTALFATGQTDSTEVSASDVSWVEKGKDIYHFKLLNAGLNHGISFIWFNMDPGKNDKGIPFVETYKLKWFQEKKFRQAIAYAMDREGMVNAAYAGLGEPIHSMIGAANRKWHNPNTRKYSYDPQKAKALLKELGFRYDENEHLLDKYGNRVEFDFLAADGSGRWEKIVTVLMDNMKAIGIDMRLQYIDFGSLVSKVHGTKEYEASGMGFTGSIDPAGGEAIYKSDGRMHLWYAEQKKPATPWEAEIDRLFEEQLAEFNNEKRVAIVHEIQSIFSEELPLIFLINNYTYNGIKDHWKNVRMAPSGSILYNIDEFWTPNPKKTL